MQLIHSPVVDPDAALRTIALAVERSTLARRRWRGRADDGREFGFELEAPLPHGATFWQTAAARYVIAQVAEAVVAIALEMAPSAAAGLGWALGNLHLELAAEPGRLLAPDEPAVRRLLERLDVPFTATTTIFRPGRFARGPLPTQELGPSHRH